MLAKAGEVSIILAVLNLLKHAMDSMTIAMVKLMREIQAEVVAVLQTRPACAPTG